MNVLILTMAITLPSGVGHAPEALTVSRPQQVPTPSADASSFGRRRALIICGHPGDEEHREMYAQIVQTVHDALTGRYGFAAEDVQVWFGTERREDAVPAVAGARGASTREAIESAAAELRERLQPQDGLWVIVLGHAHFDGRRAMLNLPGPDLRAAEFGKLFANVACREQVFFITTPVSGFFIKHLSTAGRVVISATEADLEVNETLYPLGLAKVLGSPPAPEEYDRDGDGVISMLDLYLAVARDVMKRYVDDENIPTEHAQLDDNGDGRPTELQRDYLEPELGGRARGAARPAIRPSADGAVAAKVQLFVDGTVRTDEVTRGP